MSTRSLWSIARDTFKEFLAERPFQLAAAVSYYTLLSLAPLLLVVLGVAGLVYDRGAARDELMAQVGSLIGEQGEQVVATVLDNASATGDGAWSAVLGVVLLLIGSSTVFFQLQMALNRMWNVEPDPETKGWKLLLRHRALSLALVVVIGFMLLVSLVLSAVISGVSNRAEQIYSLPAWVWQALNLGVSILVVGLLIALMFKYLPDARIAWRHVWIGAGVTAVLFTAGKFAIGLYLGRASVGSSYGAAGSVVVLMVWIYYASLILFLGAEITQVYARHSGERIEPEPYARRIPRHAPPAGA